MEKWKNDVKYAVENIIRSVPGSKVVLERLKNVICRSCVDNNEVLAGFINGNGWLFSQPKSGTNFICSAIAFYNAEILKISDYSFEDRYELGVIHGGNVIRGADGIEEALRFNKLSDRMTILRWHDDVPNARPKLLICTTRNLYDQLCSLWHYQFRPLGISVDKAIPSMVQRFGIRNAAQKLAIKRADIHLVINYEQLMVAPESEIRRIILAAYGYVDEAAVRTAVVMSGKEKFQQWESRRGAPAITVDLGKFESSFIRSGKIGEGKRFFNDRQIGKINQLAKQYSIKLFSDKL